MAAAHTHLLSSSPVAGTRLAASVQQIRLTFSEAIASPIATLTVSVDGSAPRTLTSRVDGRTISAAAGTTAGGKTQVWKVAYRVVSADSHAINGTLTFAVLTLSTPPAASPGYWAGWRYEIGVAHSRKCHHLNSK
jgi:methionine-rich copper-binding protein CopC